MTALRQLAAALEAHAHLDPALLQRAHLSGLVSERMRVLKLDSDADYVRRALSDPGELACLRDAIAVPETWLFRYPASFDLLKRHVHDAGAQRFRALCVACASGAEAYSVVATVFAAGVPHSKVEVIAIDSSAAALAHARKGQLGTLAAREGTPSWASKWFDLTRQGVTCADELGRCIEWMEGSAPKALAHLSGHFDAVFCRNLAIYLSPAARKSLGKRLLATMDPETLLFLGHAEPPAVFGLDTHVTPLEPRSSFGFMRCAVKTDACDRTQPAPAKPAAKPAVKPAAKPLAKPSVRSRKLREAEAKNEAKGEATTGATPPSLESIRAAADAGRLREALRMGEERTRMGDRSSDLLLVLGSTHAALGEDARAEETLRKVVFLEPTRTEALLQLATLAERRGDLGMASRYRGRAAKGDAT